MKTGVKCHPWFAGDAAAQEADGKSVESDVATAAENMEQELNWNALVKGFVSPPWTPELDGALDCRYFDDFAGLEHEMDMEAQKVSLMLPGIWSGKMAKSAKQQWKQHFGYLEIPPQEESGAKGKVKEEEEEEEEEKKEQSEAEEAGGERDRKTSGSVTAETTIRSNIQDEARKTAKEGKE